MILTSATLFGIYLFGKFKPDLLINVAGEVTAILGTIFILLYVIGFRDGTRYTGMLVVVYVLILSIFGG
jgi:hypothetical protein